MTTETKLLDALEEIIEIDQREKLTLVEFDPAGSTYDCENIDGPAARIARAALALPQAGVAEKGLSRPDGAHSNIEAALRDDEVERVGWAILQALHEHVDDDKRPQSWSDMNGDQEQRIRAAAVAAIECFNSPSPPEREPKVEGWLPIETAKTEPYEKIDLWAVRGGIGRRFADAYRVGKYWLDTHGHFIEGKSFRDEEGEDCYDPDARDEQSAVVTHWQIPAPPPAPTPQNEVEP